MEGNPGCVKRHQAFQAPFGVSLAAGATPGMQIYEYGSHQLQMSFRVRFEVYRYSSYIRNLGPECR